MLWKLQPIQIPPEVIFYIGPLPVTNALLGTWISIILLFLFFFLGTRRRDLIPSGMQNAVEWIIEYLLNLTEGVSGKVKARKFFPLVASFFIFILFCNLLDIFPGVDTIGTVNLIALRSAHLSVPSTFFLLGDYSDKLTPWVRPGTSDLNLTLALALVSVIVTQIFGFYTLGAKQQLSKYFNFKAFRHGFQGPIEFFVGLIELVTEISRILSFSFRLFGNIFAGSAVLWVLYRHLFSLCSHSSSWKLALPAMRKLGMSLNMRRLRSTGRARLNKRQWQQAKIQHSLHYLLLAVFCGCIN